MRGFYRTLARRAAAEYEEKKSRFVAEASPAATESDAVALVAEARARHPGASHHVFAYLTAGGERSKRCSDDGEPQGTAGAPVLDVIEKNGLEDVAVVVARYFGGTLLGAAGLIRSYGKAASLAVAAAGIADMRPALDMLVLAEYAHLDAIKNEIGKSGFFIKSIQYGLDAEILVQAPRGSSEAFMGRVSDLTNGRAAIEILRESHIMSGI
ncbi:MAG: YigZ family protein [Clostridiales bacterium]|jgi:uncharacterized YigZ family protein|nr:YigZ family protein [Clostridiales bacterium]